MAAITDEAISIVKAASAQEFDFINQIMKQRDYLLFIGIPRTYTDQSYIFYNGENMVGYFMPAVRSENTNQRISSPIVYISERNYSIHCLMSMISFIMVNLGCDKMLVEVFESNTVMLSLISRLGLRKEGVFRRNAKQPDPKDKQIFALSQSVFQKIREEMNKRY